MTDADTTTAAADWRAWQESWDRQQEWYMPDREERFRVMLDMVEALVGTSPRVLDLACGTGSITARLLDRFPDATSTGVDLDPALLAIAEGTFEGDGRVSFVTADLKDPEWPAELPYDSYDAVLTATALHWLHRDPLADLYGHIAGLVRDGGVFMNADHMVDDATPRINAAERALRHARMDRAKRDGALDWAPVVAARRPGPGPRGADGPPVRDLRRARRRRHAAARLARARAAREGVRRGTARCGARRRTPCCWR
ncbi:hypothetical protein GCM10023238_20440 [Streptomyces heliomycini]